MTRRASRVKVRKCVSPVSMRVAATAETASKRAPTLISSKRRARRTLETVKRKAAKQHLVRTKNSGPTRIVNIAQLGDVVNLKARRLYMLRHEGMPQISPGRYDLGACCRWYVRFLQRKLLERANPKEENATAAAGAMRHKMLSIESELKQIELAEKREQFVSAEKVQKDVTAIIFEIRKRILALAPKIAAEVVGETDLAVSQVKIDRSLKGALEALSEFDPDDVTARAAIET